MRPVPFPCSFVTESLCSLDFEINDYLFREAWSKLIPTADGISFLTMKRLLSVQVGLGDKDTSEIIGELKGGGNPLKAGFSTLLFPLGLGDDELVAVARGVDPVVVERASNQWLAEINSAAKQECLRIKEAGSDPLSCLYNLQSFHEFLMSADEQENLLAVLVELLPRSRQPKESYAHVWQASHDLKEFNRYRFPLFHLGQSVCSVIITGHARD